MAAIVHSAGIAKDTILVRIDERTQNLVILAGEEVAIEIQPDGDWEFTE